MAASPSGKGYWLTASDGGIFAFGDAAFFGAAPSRPAPSGDRTVTAMVPAPDGAGYWQAATSGEVLSFGSAGYFGGVGQLAKPIVGMAAVPSHVGSTTVPTGGTTNTTAPTTATTVPGANLVGFSSTAKVSWGTLPDPGRSFTNTNNQVVYPYSQEVDAISEIGNSAYIGGQFTDLVDTKQNPSGVPYNYLAQLDTTTGAP